MPLHPPSDRKIAFVTCKHAPGISEDDELARAALETLGYQVQGTPWDDEQTEWKCFAAVVLRSSWDYYRQAPRFLAWLSRLEAANILMFNSPDLVIWNHHKTYLREMHAKGVAIPETIWCPPRIPVNVAEVLRKKGWDRAVIKPCLSASSFNTWISSLASGAEDTTKLTELLQREAMMIQRYVPEIEAGELSLVFFDSTFSHAVKKTPEKGEFRVQVEFGGQIAESEVPDFVLRSAIHVLETLVDKPLYSRVDGVLVNGVFVLMELELIEPSLFFSIVPNAATRFAQCLNARIALQSGAGRRNST